MVFLNDTGTIAAILTNLQTNVTGNLFITLLLLTTLIIFIALALRIPEEATTLIIFPLLIVTAAYYKTFLPILGVAIIYIGYIIAKNLLGGRK